MTKEDALEVTLREPKYIDCPDCKGEKKKCLECYGYTRVVNPPMRKACHVLGIEEPDDLAEEFRRRRNITERTVRETTNQYVGSSLTPVTANRVLQELGAALGAKLPKGEV